MRISDWSSDVCSSDLDVGIVTGGRREDALRQNGGGLSQRDDGDGGHKNGREDMFRGHRTSLPNWVGVPPCSSSLLNEYCQTVKHQRSEEHTSELQSLMRNSYAVFCLKKKKTANNKQKQQHTTTKNKKIIKYIHQNT